MVGIHRAFTAVLTGFNAPFSLSQIECLDATCWRFVNVKEPPCQDSLSSVWKLLKNEVCFACTIPLKASIWHTFHCVWEKRLKCMISVWERHEECISFFFFFSCISSLTSALCLTSWRTGPVHLCAASSTRITITSFGHFILCLHFLSVLLTFIKLIWQDPQSKVPVFIRSVSRSLTFSVPFTVCLISSFPGSLT